MIHFFDLSHYSNVTLASLMKYRPDAFAFKCTEGTTVVDDRYDGFVAQAKKLDVPWLAYMYAHPEKSAADQVDFFLTHAKPQPGMGLANDLERGTTQTATNAWAKAVGQGYRKYAKNNATHLYMGHTYWGSGTGRGLSLYYDHGWMPRYPSSQFTTVWPTRFDPMMSGNVTGWKFPETWQFTEKWAGKFDANISTLILDQLTIPKSGGDVAFTAADAKTLLSTPLTNPLTGNQAALATFLVYSYVDALAAKEQVSALQAQVTQMQTDLAGQVTAAVNAAITAGILTVQINAKEA